MAKKLRPWLRRFHDHLKNKKEGDIITAQELMSVTEWAPVTLQTHVKKNALAPFLTPTNSLKPIQNTKFRMRRDGATISNDDIDKAFTQIRPAALTLSPGLRFKARDGDYDLVVELGRGAVAQVWQCQRILRSKGLRRQDRGPSCRLA